MSKQYLKLKDTSSIIHDIDKGVTIAGKAVIEVPIDGKTGKIGEAFRAGALTEATKEEFDAWTKSQEAIKDKREAKAATSLATKQAVAAPPAPAGPTAEELAAKKKEVAAGKLKDLQAKSDEAAEAYTKAKASAEKQPSNSQLQKNAEKAKTAADEAAEAAETFKTEAGL